MKKYIVIFAALVILSSCSPKIPFTQDIRNSIELNDIKLTEVQFYLSKDVVLRRKEASKDIKVQAGTINYMNNAKNEAITIKALTPGICESFSATAAKVGFEDGANKELQFIKNSANQYQIGADDWSTGNGKIKYDTTFYYIDKMGSDAILMIKKMDVAKFKKVNKRASGRKIK